jgi:hypothetical protein
MNAGNNFIEIHRLEENLRQYRLNNCYSSSEKRFLDC